MPAPTPAIRKVLDALVARVAVQRPDLMQFIDRSIEDPLADGEWPGVIWRVTGVRMTPFEQQGQTRVDGVIQAECQSGALTGGSIDLVNQTTIADIVAAIHSDRTLGGRMQDMEESSATPTDPLGADAGGAILDIEFIFFTPRGDLYTIVGQGGATF